MLLEWVQQASCQQLPPAVKAQAFFLPCCIGHRSDSRVTANSEKVNSVVVFLPRGSLQVMSAVKLLSIFARCLQNGSWAELFLRSLPC